MGRHLFFAKEVIAGPFIVFKFEDDDEDDNPSLILTQQDFSPISQFELRIPVHFLIGTRHVTRVPSGSPGLISNEAPIRFAR